MRSMSQVPAATRALVVLRFLATQPSPTPLDRIARATGIPRSSAYHLLRAMADEGFVVHFPDQHCYGLGVAAYEVGSGYLRQEPLQRVARLPLTRLVDTLGHSAHLAVLHGRDVLYLIEERAAGQPSLVTDTGVRLPAHLTASGRAILAGLPPSQVRALFPSRDAFVSRNGRGPATLPALRTTLTQTRTRGYAVEHDEVSEGFASIAVAVRDHNDYPIAAVAVTYLASAPVDADRLHREVARAAGVVTSRLGGR